MLLFTGCQWRRGSNTFSLVRTRKKASQSVDASSYSDMAAMYDMESTGLDQKFIEDVDFMYLGVGNADWGREVATRRSSRDCRLSLEPLNSWPFRAVNTTVLIERYSQVGEYIKARSKPLSGAMIERRGGIK